MFYLWLGLVPESFHQNTSLHCQSLKIYHSHSSLTEPKNPRPFTISVLSKAVMTHARSHDSQNCTSWPCKTQTVSENLNHLCISHLSQPTHKLPTLHAVFLRFHLKCALDSQCLSKLLKVNGKRAWLDHTTSHYEFASPHHCKRSVQDLSRVTQSLQCCSLHA